MAETYLSFTICNNNYAVDVTKVREVLEDEHITHVPNAPNYISGIINFRGDIIPVFETRIRFSLPERDKNEAFNIIVIEILDGTKTFRLGAIVDKVNDIITIDNTDIKPVSTINIEFNTEFLRGVAKLNNNLTMLINVERVFIVAELQIIKETNKPQEL